MPPVQEQLLLTDTEQTGHQGVQGLRIKKTMSPKGCSSANQEVHILRTLLWPVWVRINRTLVTQEGSTGAVLRWVFHKGFLMTMGINNLELCTMYKFHV